MDELRPPVPEVKLALHLRLVASLGILLLAAGSSYLILTQPAIGSLRGVCHNAKTGQALAGVYITLSPSPKDATEDDDPNDHPSTPPASLDDVGRTGAPGGWTENTDSDEDYDFAGADKDHDKGITAKTDDKGLFAFTNLPVGEYQLSSDSDTVSYAEQTVVIVEGHSDRITFDLKSASNPNIAFETAETSWLSTERPTFGMNGNLPGKSVTMTLERADVGDMLQNAPDRLSQASSGTDDADWDGKYEVVRTWSQELPSQDSDGDFYEHVSASDSPLPDGVYWLKAESKGPDGAILAATVRFQVTDLALITKTTSHRVECFVANLATGKAEPGITLALYQNGANPPMATGTSDADGLLDIDTSSAAKESHGQLIARSSDSLAYVTISMGSPGDSNDNSDSSDGDDSSPNAAGAYLRSLTYTERPIYRPGDTVHIKGIMRLYDAGKGYVIPSGKSVSVDIKDSQENLVDHTTVTTNGMGSWVTDFALNQEALTGQYSIDASLGEQSTEASFDVASYHKPEYQVAVTFDKTRYVHGDTVHATVAASYYYGAPVAGAKAHIDVMRSDSAGADSRGDRGASDEADSGEPLVDEDVVLDPQGKASVDFATKLTTQQSSDLTYTVSAVVTDPSDAKISGEADVTVSQGDFALDVGVSSEVAHAGDSVTLTATATNPDGKPRAGEPIKVIPSYGVWMDGKYVETKLTALSGVTDQTGQSRVQFTIPRSGEIGFAASGEDDRSNIITAETDLWAASNTENIPGRYSDLQLVLDKKKYLPGDTVHALVNTDHPGASALVTVEGRVLYQSFVIPMAKRSTQVDVKLTQELTPGVTISVCTVVDKQFLTSSSQANISDPQRPLVITIVPGQAKYHPGDTASLDVTTTDQNGSPVSAEVSVGVVDSSIYAIEEDSTPDISDAFEPSQGDAVQTEDSCERVYYGDVDKGAVNIRIRSKFVDAALWDPDLTTDSSGKGHIDFTLPDNLTTWRVTAYGHTADTRVGTSRASFEVNKDLLVRIEAPYFLTAGDSATVVGLVHNNTAKPIHAHVTFTASGLTLLDNASSDVDIEPLTPARLTWRIRSSAAGPGAVTLTASGAGLSDGVEQAIPVQPHGVFVSTWRSGTLLRQIDSEVDIEPKAIRESSFVRLHLSPSLASTIMPAVDYLTQYPYGDADSTASVLTADALVAGAAGLNSPGHEAVNMSSERRQQLRDQVDRSILRLNRMQNSAGGWGWFPGSNGVETWSSAYVAWSLIQARDAGFTVEQPLMDAAVKATADGAGAERSQPDNQVDLNTLSLCALVLARTGNREAAENNLRYIQGHWNRHTRWLRNDDVARCALAYAAKDGAASPDAHKLMEYLWSVCRVTGAESSWTFAYHSSVLEAGVELPNAEATSWALLAAETLSPGDVRIDGIARWLVANRTGDHWTATFISNANIDLPTIHMHVYFGHWSEPCDTALTLMALTRYIANSHEMQPNFAAVVSVSGRKYTSAQMTTASLDMPDTVVDIPASAFNVGVNTIRIDKIGVGRLYFSIENRQSMMQPGPSPAVPLLTRVWRAFVTGQPKLAPAPSGYRIKRSYLRMTTRRNWLFEDTVPAPESAFNTGEDILVRVIIDATRPGSRLIVSEPIPAGCTITDLTYDEREDWSNWWDYTDTRDDKIAFFVGDMSTGRHEIDYHLHVANAGTFDVLPAVITSQVDPSLQAIGATSRITVDESQQ